VNEETLLIDKGIERNNSETGKKMMNEDRDGDGNSNGIEISTTVTKSTTLTPTTLTPSTSMGLLKMKVLRSYISENPCRISKLVNQNIIHLLLTISFHSRVLCRESLNIIKYIIKTSGSEVLYVQILEKELNIVDYLIPLIEVLMSEMKNYPDKHLKELLIT
jgi:hypothetical protein